MAFWFPRTKPLACAVEAHDWVLQPLRRGSRRVEVCRRCGAVENYFDLLTELTAN